MSENFNSSIDRIIWADVSAELPSVCSAM